MARLSHEMKVTYLLLREHGTNVHTDAVDEHFERVDVPIDLMRMQPSDIYKLFVHHQPKLIVTVGTKEHYAFMNHVSVAIQRFWRHVPFQTPITSDLLDDLYAQVTFTTDAVSHPLFSVFTTTFNTREKISIPYESLCNQSYPHWEWVIFDDSDKPDTWHTLVELANKDPRVRVFKGHRNIAYIGEVKKLVCSLCRGDFLVELDHDDELHPECFQWVYNASLKFPSAKFFHTDCIEMFENTRMCHTYGDTYAFGCAGHYRTILHGWDTCEGRWITGQRSSLMNHMTLRYIVGVPNHVRVWKRDAYWELGGHRENMAVADDYELILRTFLKYPSVYIREIGYLQYRNEEGNNFTFLRNSLIQRKTQITAKHYNEDIHSFLEKLHIPDPSYHEVQCEGPSWQRVSPDEHPRLENFYVPYHHTQDAPCHISIVIPTCNNITKLSRAIQSVFAQSYPHWSLYIVGNKCPELDHYMESNLQLFMRQSKTNRIMYWNFQKESYGMYACKNYAIRYMIDEEWVTYLEDSFYWSPNHLQSMVDAIQAKPNSRFVYSGVRVGTTDIRCKKPMPFFVDPSNLLHQVSLLREKGYWMHPNDVQYTDAWELVQQWFDEPYATTQDCTVLSNDLSLLTLATSAHLVK
jgi:glycosyltransferase involved in cell wall biosynthesis